MIYYGSAFDPITTAHEAIIEKLKSYGEKLVIGISANDEKLYTESFENRVNLVNYAINQDNGLDILKQTERTFAFIENNFKGETVNLCIGSDNMDRILKGDAGGWKNTDKLINRVNKFYVVPRDSNVHYDMPGKIEILDIDLSKYSTVSSSSVRYKLLKDPMIPFSMDLGLSVNAYQWIKRYELYKQNPDDYLTKEAAYILTHSSSDYPRPSVTADIVATWSESVLLIRRGNYPYKNYFALPGGFFNPIDYIDPHTGERNKADLDINYTAQRELFEETKLAVELKRFKQIKTYAHKFDPRGRIVDIAFSVELTKDDVNAINSVVAGDDAIEVRWFPINRLPKLAFHHEQIIKDWLESKEVR